jgi:ArsR family transcriptional regulator, arsenate/arsenite/antimonite-responsive transcriptional repressor
MVELTGIDEYLAARVATLKCVAEPIRWQVIQTLGRDGARCHCDLEAVLGVPANLMSHHLRVLRDAGLVTTHRRGKQVEYRLDGAAADRLHDALPDIAPDLVGAATEG